VCGVYYILYNMVFFAVVQVVKRMWGCDGGRPFLCARGGSRHPQYSTHPLHAAAAANI